MLRIATLTIAIGLTLLICTAPSTAAESFIRAVVVDGQVYVSPLSNGGWCEPSWKEQEGHFTLLGQKLVLRDQPVTLKHPSVIESRPFTHVLHRWHVDRKRVHFLRYDPLDVSGVEPFLRNMRIVSFPLALSKGLQTPIPATQEGNVRLHEFDRTSTGEDAGPQEWAIRMRRHSALWNGGRVFFDFLPAGDSRYEWYASEPDGERNRITRWDSQPAVKKGDSTKWVEAGVWTADVGSAFFATSSGLDRNFVSDTGRVLAAPRAAKAGTPLKEIWKDWKDKPVVALIHDADKSKWFAFTKDQYFEATDPIKPSAHTLAINRAKTANEALETAAKCARVIRGLPEPKAK